MKAYDLMELAARNLRESVLRSSLTTLGIGVGVASLVAMLSLGVGLQELANKRLEKSGLFDTIVVTSEREFGREDRGENQRSQKAAQPVPLDEKARAEISHLPNVLGAYPDIRFVTEIRYAGQSHMTMVAGLPMSDRDRDAFDAMAGKFFSAGAAPEAILQGDFAEELLGIHRAPSDSSENANPDLKWSQPLIGKELTLHYAERSPSSQPSSQTPTTAAGADAGHPSTTSPESSAGAQPVAAFSVVSREVKLRVVGVTGEDPEAMRGRARGRVFVPLAFAESLHILLPTDLNDSSSTFSSDPTFRTITVRVTDPNLVGNAEDAIKKMGFHTFSILDATRSLRRFFAILDLFLGIFGSLALAVASLGIVNTLVMAILERRREIGIMKAIGAGDADVKKLFFVEAGAMGALGGVLGVALGWLIGRAINFGADIYLHAHDLPSEQFWSVPWWLAAGALGFAVVVSMISGLYPAARAAKLDPVQALRYE